MQEQDEPGDESKPTSNGPDKEKSKAIPSDNSTEANTTGIKELDEPDEKSKPTRNEPDKKPHRNTCR